MVSKWTDSGQENILWIVCKNAWKVHTYCSKLLGRNPATCFYFCVMDNSVYIKCFLKFGEKKFMKDLQRNGTIYMRPLNDFRGIEDEELRGDSYEGVASITNHSHGTFEIPAIGFKGEYQHIHYCERSEFVLGNIFSMYCVSNNDCPDPMKFTIDSRMKRFGSHILLIKDNPEFLNRIRQSLVEQKTPFREGFVRYYNRNEINGKISVFQKPDEFAYQREFRIFAYQKQIQPMVLNIGNLEGISELFPIHAVDTFKLEPSLQPDLL